MNNNNNKKFTLNWLKNNFEFIITLLGIIIAVTVAWTSLQAQVNYNYEKIIENKNVMRENQQEIKYELKEINDVLNNDEYGLKIIHQRLKFLENKK